MWGSWNVTMHTGLAGMSNGAAAVQTQFFEMLSIVSASASNASPGIYPDVHT